MKRSISLFRQFSSKSQLPFAVFVVVSAILELASIWVVRELILSLFTPAAQIVTPLSRLSSQLGVGAGISLFSGLLAVLAFFLVKNFIMFVLWQTIVDRLGIEQHYFSVRLFERYLRAPYLRHIDKSKITLQQNLNVATTQVFIFSILPLMQIFVEAIVAAGIVIYLFIVSPVATLALLVWIALAVALFRLVVTRKAGETGQAQRESFGGMLRISQESLRDIKSIRLWGREKFSADLFGNASMPFAKSWSKARMLQQIPRFMLEPFLIGALVAFAITLALLNVSYQALLLDLSIFAAAGTRLLPGATRAVVLFHTIAFYEPDLNAVWADIEAPIEPLEERPSGKLPPPFARDIKIEGIAADYGVGARAILHNVNLQIMRGDKIAIFGASGCGKTTLLNVLLGFVPVRAGKILFDGCEEAPMSRFRRSSTSFVPQDIFLINDTILANVAFSALTNQVDEAEVWECLKIAHLSDHVKLMPSGLQTRIGDDGTKLSGGERQRLALARALYQRPTFLVLDEATSQLDIESEGVILDRLFAYDPNLTVVMVTHRAGNARFFTRRFHVENGIFIETD